jgi:hypothetical protein
MHFFGQASVLFGLGMALSGLLMIVFKLGWLRLLGIDYQADFIETPLPALAATFFTASVLSVFFGVLGEILTRVYHEAQGLHPYRVAEVLQPIAPESPRPGSV